MKQEICSLLRVHVALSLVVSLPLVWLALTGALLAFADNVDRIIAVDLMTVAPQQQPFNQAQMDVFVESVQQKHSDYRLSLIAYPNARSESLRTLWNDASDQTREVFINPYDGTLLGSRLVTESFSARVRALHTLGYTPFDAFRSPVLTLIVMLGFIVLISGMWRFATMQMSSVTMVGSQHAIIGLVLLLPISTILISAIVLLQLEHTGALLWHTGALLGFGGRVVWLLVTLALAWFICAACYKYLAVRFAGRA